MTLQPEADARKPAKARLSITPMIDVVFLLLIFFMVGMKFKELDRRLDAKLPPLGDSGRIGPVPTEIWIEVRNGGTASAPRADVRVGGVAIEDWDHLHAHLAHLAGLLGGRADPVVVAPADDALHDWVMTVLDHLSQLEFRNVGFRR